MPRYTVKRDTLFRGEFLLVERDDLGRPMPTTFEVSDDELAELEEAERRHEDAVHNMRLRSPVPMPRDATLPETEEEQASYRNPRARPSVLATGQHVVTRPDVDEDWQRGTYTDDDQKVMAQRQRERDQLIKREEQRRQREAEARARADEEHARSLGYREDSPIVQGVRTAHGPVSPKEPEPRQVSEQGQAAHERRDERAEQRAQEKEQRAQDKAQRQAEPKAEG